MAKDVLATVTMIQQVLRYMETLDLRRIILTDFRNGVHFLRNTTKASNSSSASQVDWTWIPGRYLRLAMVSEYWAACREFRESLENENEVHGVSSTDGTP